MIYDISPPITPKINVWPGDTPFSRNVLCDIERGSNITLSSITSTVHLGAHADGPNHYTRTPVGIGERPLAYFLGPCQVIDAPVARNSRVQPRDLQQPITAPRVLLRTSTFPSFEQWNNDFAALSPELVEYLATLPITNHEPGVPSLGVITIGIDTPSVDLQDSKDLPAHTAIARHDMQILEGLRLDHVPAGHYELIALPLKILGCDASPIRAILRTLTP